MARSKVNGETVGMGLSCSHLLSLMHLTAVMTSGDVDSILKKKEPLNDLRDIFHYQDIPCPRS